jgi:hypothetical protein
MHDNEIICGNMLVDVELTKHFNKDLESHFPSGGGWNFSVFDKGAPIVQCMINDVHISASILLLSISKIYINVILYTLYNVTKHISTYYFVVMHVTSILYHNCISKCESNYDTRHGCQRDCYGTGYRELETCIINFSLPTYDGGIQF